MALPGPEVLKPDVACLVSDVRITSLLFEGSGESKDKDQPAP